MAESEINLPAWHEKQLQFFESEASEILYAGDTRAGKSFAVRKALILWCSQIPGLLCDIFRLHHDDVVKENMTGETGFPILLRQWELDGLVVINQTEVKFWNDSQIWLEHCNDDAVMFKHQGVARHVRVFSESTQIFEHRIRALTGWVTMSEEMKSRVPPKWKGRFPKAIHVTNPKGVSSNYYRRNFVEARPPYKIEKVGQFNRQYIPAFLDDNPSEDADATRARIAEAFPDVRTQKSLINEDKSGITNWRMIGGDFFPEWDRVRHVVKDFSPPHWWYRFRCMDLGYAEPFAVYWIAVSDGEIFTGSDGKKRWFPRGAFIVYNEWYGCESKDPAKGLRMRNEDIAEGILGRSELEAKNVVTLTDSLPFQDRGGEAPHITFRNNGVALTLGDTSRVAGWNQMRSRLIGIPKEVGSLERYPMIYFCESCKYATDYIPALPCHPSENKKEDAAEHGEATHSPDAIRIGCMAHTIIKDSVLPTQARIERDLNKKRPTIKNIIGNFYQ